MYTWLDTQITDTQCIHTNMDSTNSLTLIPTLAEQDRGPLEGVYVHIYRVNPSSSKAQALSLPSS